VDASHIEPIVSFSPARRRRYFWDLVSHLVAREFRLRYRRALFGWLWAIGSPITRLIVLTFVFTKVLPLDIPDYPVFVFSGLIAWSWFSAGLSSATSSAVDRRDLLFRPGLSRTAVPVVSVLTDGLDYLAALPVLLVFLVVLSDGVPATALLLPAVLAVQLLLTLGLGFALCSANVYFRDVRLFVDIATTLGFYLTPVFYQGELVAETYPIVLQVNPMAHLMGAYRAILLPPGRIPDLASFGLLAGCCVIIFIGGYAAYRRTSASFVDQL